MASLPTICAVIPVHNEEENLPELTRRLRASFEKLPDFDWKVILVNDGSADQSASLILQLRAEDPRFCLLDLSRNFGHQAALSAGLAYSDGDVVVMMDADLQDPPELIPDMVSKWREGFEVVYAVRRRRKGSVLKRALYAIFYRMNRMIAQVNIPLDAGDFCLMDRCVVEAVCGLPERNRFLRGLRSWVGFRQIGYEYDRPDRFAGTTKYSLLKLVRLAVSGFIGFSTVPLRLASWIGLASACTGFLVGAWAIGTRILNIAAPRGWASLISTIMFLGGVQLMLLGILGEYVGNVNEEVRRRPVFIVRKFYSSLPPPARWQRTDPSAPAVDPPPERDPV